MTGQELRKYRKEYGLTQEQVCKLLGVSQTYLSLLESNKRPFTADLKQKLVRKLKLQPTQMPSDAAQYKVAKVSDDQLTADLSALGYTGFSHYKPGPLKNPADVLLSALNADQRDARLVEALPWVVLAFPDMDWKSLVMTAKAYDLQNRLGFVTNLARLVSEMQANEKVARKLKSVESQLALSRLEREDTLCNQAMTNAEKNWLFRERPTNAKQWHLLTGFLPEHLRYYAG